MTDTDSTGVGAPTALGLHVRGEPRMNNIERLRKGQRKINLAALKATPPSEEPTATQKECEEKSRLTAEAREKRRKDKKNPTPVVQVKHKPILGDPIPMGKNEEPGFGLDEWREQL